MVSWKALFCSKTVFISESQMVRSYNQKCPVWTFLNVKIRHSGLKDELAISLFLGREIKKVFKSARLLSNF